MTDATTKAARNRVCLWAGAAAAALVAALAACALLRGCGAEPEAPGAAAARPSRLEDPEYRAALEAQRQAQVKVLGAMDAVRRRIAAAEAEGAGDEALQALKDELRACAEDYERERQRAQDVIRARILKDIRETNNK